MPSSNNESNHKLHRPLHKTKGKDKRYVLSARAQSTLMWILEDVIEKTLEDARRMAEAAGKQQVELAEVELALKKLCQRYHVLWQSEAAQVQKTEAAKAKVVSKRR